jgi:hypothetical protein
MALSSGALIQGKLQAWAYRNGIELQGSAGVAGAPNYTLEPEHNLFGSQLLPETRRAFEEGAGGELRGDIPTMSALHSSAAMAVNLFQYWLGRPELDTLAQVLAVPSRRIVSAGFEERFPVCGDAATRGLRTDPHLDFALVYEDGSCVGVECKLYEPYGRLSDKRLKPPYLALDAWADVPACRQLADVLNRESAGFRRLDACQLIKHILGLKAGRGVSQWRLLYLYLDAPGEEAAEHRAEIKAFANAIASDGISFNHLSVQEFILRAVATVRTNHQAYVDYLAARYL